MRSKGYSLLVLVCLFYWLLDSIWSYLSFELNLKKLIFSQPSTYLDTFLLNVPPYQIVSRLMVTALFIILGALILEFFIKKQSAEEKQREAYNTFLRVLDSIDATIYVADLKTNEILFMNNFMVKHFNGDYRGALCYEVFRGNTSVCSHCTNQQIVDEAGEPKEEVVVWEGYNPVSRAWYINYDRAIRWVDGRIAHLQIATDITDLKELQEKQRDSEAQLRQAQKMESVGRLAGGIAHDFNNLLTAIIGYSELALDNSESVQQRDRNIRAVLQASNQAKELVTQILAFSRRLEPSLKPTDLNTVVERTAVMLERVIPRMIEIEISTATNLRMINADSNQLAQVIMNLGTNAKDAMPDGGRFVIKTGNATLDRAFCDRHAEAKPGDYVLLTVTDTGSGMDSETIKHIFDPYFTQKEIGKGTGLGLATAYGIIKSHNGYIYCYSEVGRGTSFKLYFPALRIIEDEAKDTSDEVEVVGGRETVLIVDDVPAIINLGRELLEREGYTVLQAGTGEEALEVYEKDGQGIDLVILDVSMPGMGGHNCLIKLIELDPGVKVVIASGYSLGSQLNDVISSGAAGFIGKPFSSSDLLVTVREVLDN